MIAGNKNTQKQSLVENNRYEILTPNGWEDFLGVTKNQKDFESIEIETKSGKTIHSTKNHRHCSKSGEYIPVNEFKENDEIHTTEGLEKIIHITEKNLSETYDIFKTDSNTVIVNKVYTHNCDELAFVKSSIQEKFWTSISPTLATGGKCIISSTPNGNSNLFAELWRGANNEINSFKYKHVPWDAPPGRDEEFKRQQIGKIGKRKWYQEYECCHPTSLIELSDNDERMFVKVPISLAYECLRNNKDIFNLSPPCLTGKYVISPLDGNKYCRKNGRFLMHLKENGYISYEDFFESLFPQHKKVCSYCRKTASFNNSTMSYLRTCGDRVCVGKETS